MPTPSVYYSSDGHRLTIYNATQEFMDTLEYTHIPSEITIHGDYIPNLRVPEGVQRVHCEDCGVRNLTLPSSIITLICNENYIAHITVPATIEHVNLQGNLLETFTVEGGHARALQTLDLQRNRIAHLDFEVDPNRLTYFDLRLNTVESFDIVMSKTLNEAWDLWGSS